MCAYNVRCLKKDCLLQASKQIRPEDQLLISMMANTGIAACSNGSGEIAHSADGSVGVRTIHIYILHRSQKSMLALHTFCNTAVQRSLLEDSFLRTPGEEDAAGETGRA